MARGVRRPSRGRETVARRAQGYCRLDGIRLTDVLTTSMFHVDNAEAPLERDEFERIRDLAAKVIEDDIVFEDHGGHRHVVRAKKVQILNASDKNLYLHVTVNRETEEVNLNVTHPGTGPICRLDVRSNEHPPGGRNHKHDLKVASCPPQNLRRGVTARPEVESMTFIEAFEWFCKQAQIEFRGQLGDPFA